MRGFAVVAIAVLAAGCARYVWVQPTVTEQQRDQDLEECKNAALSVSVIPVMTSPMPLIPVVLPDPGRLNQCMTERGYRQVRSDEVPPSR